MYETIKKIFKILKTGLKGPEKYYAYRTLVLAIGKTQIAPDA